MCSMSMENLCFNLSIVANYVISSCISRLVWPNNLNDWTFASPQRQRSDFPSTVRIHCYLPSRSIPLDTEPHNTFSGNCKLNRFPDYLFRRFKHFFFFLHFYKLIPKTTTSSLSLLFELHTLRVPI